MTQLKKRLGVIGCGQHARRSHVAVGEDFQVTAIFDPSPESRQAMLDITGKDVAVCLSPEELVHRDDVDVVLIASIDAVHPEQLALTIAAGKSVLCEKPLAISTEGMAVVERALLEAKEKGLVVTSCHLRRDSRNSDLSYGWVKANLDTLTQQFGALRQVGFHSAYPKSTAGWKANRSFLTDKVSHDIDYLRFLLGELPFTARRLMDSADHYEVAGEIGRPGAKPVKFTCLGTRLHSAKNEFIEILTLTFEHGTCAMYAKTGLVRYHDHRSHQQWSTTIAPMTQPDAYDQIFTGLMRDFAAALEGGAPSSSFDDLRVNAASAIALAGPQGHYTSSPALSSYVIDDSVSELSLD